MDIAGLDGARMALGLSMADLWLSYYALGGQRDATDLARYLAGGSSHTTTTDYDTIALALNEAQIDRGGGAGGPYSSR